HGVHERLDPTIAGREVVGDHQGAAHANHTGVTIGGTIRVTTRITVATRTPMTSRASRSARAHRTGERHGVHRGDVDRLTRTTGVDELSVAEVDPDVTDRSVEEHQVAGLQLAPGDPCPGADLRARRAWQRDTGLTPRRRRQPGAIVGVWAGLAVTI